MQVAEENGPPLLFLSSPISLDCETRPGQEPLLRLVFPQVADGTAKGESADKAEREDGGKEPLDTPPSIPQILFSLCTHGRFATDPYMRIFGVRLSFHPQSLHMPPPCSMVIHASIIYSDSMKSIPVFVSKGTMCLS